MKRGETGATARPAKSATGATDGNGHRLLTAGEILAADDVRTVRVHVPEWDGDVLVRSLTWAAQKAWLEGLPDGKPEGAAEKHAELQMIVLMLVDEQGNQLFTLEQLGQLAERSATAMKRIVEAVNSLNDWAAELEAARQD